MITIGLIGPIDSLKLVNKAASDLPVNVTLKEYCYKELEELEKLEEFCNDVDMFLFSGPAPYFWVKEQLELSFPMRFIPRNGTGLYRVLFNIMKENEKITYLSTDTIARKDVLEALEELSIPFEDVKTLENDSIQSFNEVTQFHLENYKKNKSTIVISGMSGPYKALSSMGIKTYRVHPTQSIIRSSIEKAILMGQSETNKESQIALIIIHADQDMKNNGAQYDYKFQIQLLDLYQILLSYSDKIQATVLKTGDKEFMLISTRGSLADIPNINKSLPQYIRMRSQLLVDIGVGFGKTARIAETHAREAVVLSKQNNSDCCYILTDKGDVIEPNSEEKSNSSSLNKVAEELEISVESLSNIKTALRRMGKKEITPKELSQALSLSERSARRILKNLEGAGAAEIVGNKSVYKKGRPRCIYKVLL